MAWDQIYNYAKEGAELVKRGSVKCYNYVTSDEFKDKVVTGVKTTKEGVENLVVKVKNSETTQKIVEKTKDVCNDIKQSQIVQNIGEKSKQIVE